MEEQTNLERSQDGPRLMVCGGIDWERGSGPDARPRVAMGIQGATVA